MSAVRNILKALLVRLAIYQPYIRLRHLLRFGSFRYRGIKRQAFNIEDITVNFNTSDPYSRDWFFPRYANGAIHEKQASKLLIRELRSSQVFVDVGANLGWFTCLASKCMPSGQVFSFEMDSQNFALLEANISLNNCGNVHSFAMAVSNSDGFASYQRAARLPSTNFAIESDFSSAPTFEMVQVPTTSLDSFCRSKQISPDLVKIDVEGAEMVVLMGMKSILTHDQPRLLLEIHPTYLPRFGSTVIDVVTYLHLLDYSIYEIKDPRGQSDELRLEKLVSANNLKNNSMVYVIKGTSLSSYLFE